jgi:hypothetical protein
VPPSQPEVPGGAPQPTVAGTPPKRKRSRRRTIVLVVLGALAFLCVGGVGVAYVLYNQATQPDRTTPAVTVRQYVEAKLNDRNDIRAHLFLCDKTDDPTPIADLASDIQNRERQFNVHANVAMEGFETNMSGNRATVTVTFRISVSTGGNFQELFQHWEFTLSHGANWRICNAHQTS